MNRANLSGLKRSLTTSLRHCKDMYNKRPINFWYKQLRKYELAMQCLQEYEERAGK
jgi:hypothetical protein